MHIIIIKKSETSFKLDIWMVRLPNRLTPFEKLQVKVEDNKKILYIAFKLSISTYDVDSIIANVSSITRISFEYVQIGTKKVL